jgi:undecaprenyl-diphosphatase
VWHRTRAADPPDVGATPRPSIVLRVRERRGRRLARSVIALAVAGFAALYALVRADRSAGLDLAITLRIQGRTTPLLETVMTAASWPGFPPQSRVIPPIVIAAAWASGHRREARFLVLAWGGALISTVVKATVRRPRPLPPKVRVVLAPLGGTSFPSGHVLTYVGWYGFLAHLVAVHVRQPLVRRGTVAALVGLVGLVGPSRIEQGHHWATDVLASYLLGLGYLVALIELYGRGLEPRDAVGRAVVAALERAPDAPVVPPRAGRRLARIAA